MDAAALGGVGSMSNRRNSFVARAAPTAVAAHAPGSKSSNPRGRTSLVLSGLNAQRRHSETSDVSSEDSMSSPDSASDADPAHDVHRGSQLLPPEIGARTLSKGSSHSRRSSLATSESSKSEELNKFSLLEKRLRVETEFHFNAALLKVFDNVVLGPDMNPWEPMTRNEFMYVMKPLKKLSEENLKALFHLDGHRQSDGKAIPQELALRALAGLGYKCRQLKVHLGYRVEEEKPARAKAAAKAKGKTRSTLPANAGLVVAGPSNMQALSDQSDDSHELASSATGTAGTRLTGRDLLMKAVRKVGLTTRLLAKKDTGAGGAASALTVVGNEAADGKPQTSELLEPARRGWAMRC